VRLALQPLDKVSQMRVDDAKARVARQAFVIG
jgi:hypothetical protein